jgi:hypothetical protein
MIKEVLLTYERGTGQLINLLKFGSKCSDTMKTKVLGKVPNTTVEEKYLGLPTPDGKNV